MSKLYYEALSKMPKKFIDDETRHCEHDDATIIANPKYAPMIYRNGEWKEIKVAKGDIFSNNITIGAPIPIFRRDKL